MERVSETLQCKVLPLDAKWQLRYWFEHLKQNGRSAYEYDLEFSMLCKYAPKMVKDPEVRAYRFLQGLDFDYQESITSADLPTQEVVLKAAQNHEDTQRHQRAAQVEENMCPPMPLRDPFLPTHEDIFKKTRIQASTSRYVTCFPCRRAGHRKKECHIGSDSAFGVDHRSTLS